MLKQLVMVFFFSWAAANAVAEKTMRDELTFSPKWRVQPARSVDVPPASGDWGEYPQVPWQWNSVKPSPCPWRNVDKTQVNRLWYENSIAVPSSWSGGTVKLRFDRVEGDAVVFFNGRRLAELPAPAGELDVTQVVRYGQSNRLQVYVTRDYAGISRPFERDLLRYAARGPKGRNLPMTRWPLGITAPVSLVRMPTAHIAEVTVDTSWRKKELTVSVSTVAAATGATVTGEVCDIHGHQVLTLKSAPLASPSETVILRQSWRDPIPWQLDRGYLYTMELRLVKDGRALDELPSFKFGFREIWQDGRNLMINGIPTRLRLQCTGINGDGLTPPVLSMYRLLGFNTVEFQPNPTGFYCDWNDWPYISQEVLDRLDHDGWGVLLPAPAVSNLRFDFLDNAELRREYENELKLWIKRYRNHPSILAWIPSMNFVGSIENIHAEGMGKRSNVGDSGATKILNQAIAMLKKNDPTRLAFGHAEGNIGDISSSNVYLNFVPLQEREEWPQEWNRHGNLPYLAVEFGQPFSYNYWKGPRFLLTEYMAMYFGERAYREEGVGALPPLTGKTLTGENMYTNWSNVDTSLYPLVWEFEKLFMVNTYRSWRGWGVTGWFNWDFDIGYGEPPGKSRKERRHFDYYKNLPATLTIRPDWANSRFDYIRTVNQPLLAWLAGSPVQTDKTHAFYAGEKITKAVALVWDGPGEKKITAEWNVRLGTQRIGEGKIATTLKPGEIRFIPFEFTAPEVTARDKGQISLQLSGEPAKDEFKFEVFPVVKAETTTAPVQLWDPVGRTAQWFGRQKIKYRKITSAGELRRDQVLIVGREALSAGRSLPFAAADVNAGLKAIIMEQRPEAWESLGFKTLETMPGYLFIRDRNHPLFAGLTDADLTNWRGAPDLLPEKQWARSYDFYRAPKWTNTHAVASVMIEIPRVVGFDPLLLGEFDLKYSPLLRFRAGTGVIYFSSLDFCGRIGSDPVATLMAHRLLQYVATEKSVVHPSYAAADDDKRAVELLAKLQVETQSLSTMRNPGGAVIVAGATTDAKLRQYAKDGATVFVLPCPEKLLLKDGYRVKKAACYRLPEGQGLLFQGIGPDLLRWRDKLDLVLFSTPPSEAELMAGGAVLLERVEPGSIIRCQIDPLQLIGRYGADTPAGQTISPSVEKGFQLYAELLTNIRASAAPQVLRRLCSPQSGNTFTDLNS